MRQKCLINILIKSQVMLGLELGVATSMWQCLRPRVDDAIKGKRGNCEQNSNKTRSPSFSPSLSLYLCEHVQPRKSQVFVQLANFGLTQNWFVPRHTHMQTQRDSVPAPPSLSFPLVLLLSRFWLTRALAASALGQHLALATPPCRPWPELLAPQQSVLAFQTRSSAGAVAGPSRAELSWSCEHGAA